jgi:hypothetical protein
MIVFVPLGVFAGAIHLDPLAVFVLKFLAIMTLAPILGFATKRLSASMGCVVGELIHAMSGNAVEMTVSQNQPVIIPAKLIFIDLHCSTENWAGGYYTVEHNGDHNLVYLACKILTSWIEDKDN